MKWYHILWFLCLLFSCTTKEHRISIKEHYPSGSVKREGWYTKDTIPLDTVRDFYENGQLSAIWVYDSKGSGDLNGTSLLYFENGHLKKERHFVNSKLEGFSYFFSENGNLFLKAFYLDGNRFGDTFEYDSVKGVLDKYGYYFSDTSYASYIEYDKNGLPKSGVVNRDVLFNFKMGIKSDTSVKGIEKICEMLLVPSNPPKCRTQVNISFTSRGGFTFLRDSVIKEELHHVWYTLPDSIHTVKFYATQYDSSINKTYKFVAEEHF